MPVVTKATPLDGENVRLLPNWILDIVHIIKQKVVRKIQPKLEMRFASTYLA
jgi:hypothetical protein